MSFKEQFTKQKVYTTTWGKLKNFVREFFLQEYPDIVEDVLVERSEYEVYITLTLKKETNRDELPEELADQLFPFVESVDEIDIEWEETYPFISKMLGENVSKCLTTEDQVHYIMEAA